MDAAVLDMIAVMAHRIACKCYVRPTYPDVLRTCDPDAFSC